MSIRVEILDGTRITFELNNMESRFSIERSIDEKKWLEERERIYEQKRINEDMAKRLTEAVELISDCMKDEPQVNDDSMDIDLSEYDINLNEFTINSCNSDTCVVSSSLSMIVSSNVASSSTIVSSLTPAQEKYKMFKFTPTGIMNIDEFCGMAMKANNNHDDRYREPFLGCKARQYRSVRDSRVDEYIADIRKSGHRIELVREKIIGVALA